MKLKHFVYGKFNSEESGLRIHISGGITTKNELYNEIVHKIGNIGARLADESSSAELVLRLEENYYVYVRYFPHIKDNHLRSISCFHAFVLSKEDLMYLNYAPWVLEQYFIEAFEADKIIGYDGKIWKKIEETGEKNIEIVFNTEDISRVSQNNIQFSWPKDELGKIIQSSNYIELLKLLDIEQRWYLCFMGILFVNSIDKIKSADFRDFKFVFVKEVIKSKVNTSGFKQITEAEFLEIKPNIGKGETNSDDIKHVGYKVRPENEKNPLENSLAENQNIKIYSYENDNNSNTGGNNSYERVNSKDQDIKTKKEIENLKKELKNGSRYKLFITLGFLLLTISIPIIYEFIIIPKRSLPVDPMKISKVDTVLLITTLNERNQVLESENVNLKTEKENLTKQVNNLKSSLTQQTPDPTNTEIQNLQTLRSRIISMGEEIDKLKDDVRSKEEDIRRLKDDVKSKEENIKKLNDDIKLKDEEIKKLKDSKDRSNKNN